MILLIYRAVAYLIYGVLYSVARAKAARGSKLWQGRLGLIDKVGPRSIWIHASSVGEVRVIGHLIDFLKRKKPSLTIHATAVTPAGFKTAESQFGDTITFSYFPLDVPCVMRRTLDKIQPDIIVIAETEIWPNLVCEASRRKIPLVLVNGRMSESALGRYRCFRASLGRLLSKYDRFFLKSLTDADRFANFGIEPDKYEVAGDMKFDAPLPKRSRMHNESTRCRAQVDNGDFLMVAGSTRPGEEALMADLFKRMRARFDNFRMIIAPRHVERVDEIAALLAGKGLAISLYGKGAGPADPCGVVLVDRVGILNDLYLAADLAFVGGTLVDIGGHNLLEPVWAGTPVLFGPYLSNVEESAEYILAHNYGAMAASGEEMESLVEKAYQGKTKFSIKTRADLTNSATARAGSYILDKLTDA